MNNYSHLSIAQQKAIATRKKRAPRHAAARQVLTQALERNRAIGLAVEALRTQADCSVMWTGDKK